ncbi:hypothetical protein [Viridibacterium curvum]|uniref:hypothetical protein n=1 Tax=Viridibacterium curvum TaxID=1101404 RepID=UPI0031E6A19F
MSTTTLAFRLACEPDVAGLRALHALPAGLSDFQVIEYALQKQRAADKPDSLPAALQRVVALAAIEHGADGMRCHQWALEGGSERELLQQFLARINAGTRLVCWSAAELPILLQRALLNACESVSWPNALRLAPALAEGQEAEPQLEVLASLAGIGSATAEGLTAIQRCRAEVVLIQQILLRYRCLHGELTAVDFQQALAALAAAENQERGR